MYNLQDYNYELPNELIAQNPIIPGDSCKLLLMNSKKNYKNIDLIFRDFINLVDSNSVIILNNTKVIKSRIMLNNSLMLTKNGINKFINNGEIFYLRSIDSNHFEALVRPGKKFDIGAKIYDGDYIFEVVDFSKDGRIIKVNFDILNYLENYGKMPLPPYISYSNEKELPYQPLFADKPGSVASPTACLHFTQNMLDDLKKKGIKFEYSTLHIGLGTFKTVDCADIRNYDIHNELVEVDLELFSKLYFYKKNKIKIIAVGTTVTRILESMPYLWMYLKIKGVNIKLDSTVEKFWDNIVANLNNSTNFVQNFVNNDKYISFDTKLFIFPGFDFKIIDEIITNFHLPKSSLLMLVSAFAGYENIINSYKYAIQNKYRFFSFGDAMRIK